MSDAGEAGTAGFTAGGGAGAGAGARCACLRTKGMFIDVEPDPLVPNPHDGLPWCRHTLTCLGPDGEAADERNCRPGRSCYEET